MEDMKKETRYCQLSYEERVSIKTLLGQQVSIRQIARTLGRSPNTIGRELKEKQVKASYQAKKAQHKTYWRRNHRRGGPKRSAHQHRDSLKRRLANRPAVTGSGHWELDFIVSRQSPAVLLVVVDRYSRKTLIYPLKHKTHRALLGVLREIKIKYLVKTVTTDNDLVFRRWQKLEQVINTPFFFTQPYHSWEKGLVENTNRWIRTFVPKRRDLATVTGAELHSIKVFLNETPRQCLSYKTAEEVELEQRVS